MSWSHRPALDGLRTVAVFLVVLFHSGVPGVDGGFLGVDLFFVLSGFLVSSILLDEAMETGRLRLGRFYARRVRRLLPAAIVVVVATSAVFLLLSSTVSRLPWTGDGQASLLYVANWRFLLQSNDYFAADIDKSPFLHFWSLSIEEQFYFAFPLVLLLLMRLRRRWRPALVVGMAGIAALSVIAQVYWAGVDANHAYYGTDARIYQLLFGVLGAMWWRWSRQREIPDPSSSSPSGDMAAPGRGLRLPGAGWLCLAVLLVTASSLGPSSLSVRGLVAAVASIGLILAVMGQTDRSLVALLSRPAMTYLGQISYGIYLWHWPVVLAVLAVVDVPPWVLAVLVAGLSTGLAAASYQLLEMPIRRSPRLAPFGFPTLVVGVACSALVAVTVVPQLLQREHLPALRAASGAVAGTEKNHDGPVPRGIDWEKYRDEKGAGSHECSTDDQTSCVVHEGGSGLDVAVIGDSHGRQFASVMEPLAEEHDFTLSLNVSGGCPWQLGVITPEKMEADAQTCTGNRDELYGGLLRDMGVDTVVLSQNARERPDQIRAPDGEPIPVKDLLQAQADSVEQLVEQGLHVVIIETFIRPGGDKEEGGFNPLECLSAARRISECRVPAPLTTPVSDANYRLLAVDDDGVATVNINHVMCPAWPVCDAMEGRIPVWRDSGHYSADALIKHRDEIWELLRATGYFDGAG